jgi:hypothetical protein
MSSKSFLARGSPPENLTLLTPNFAAVLTMAEIVFADISFLLPSSPSLWQ